MAIYGVSTNMDFKVEESHLVVNEVGPSSAMFLGAPEPCDSGFDSDDDPQSRRRNRLANEERISESSAGEEDYEMYEQLARGDQIREDKADADVLIEWRKSAILESGEMSEGSADRSSPPFCVFELSPSDEDDDASVLELVIPMQSRYQRVPTSSPKKITPKSPTLLSHIFCCLRK